MKIIPVEGNTQWLDGGSMFGHVPKALWETWLQPDERNRVHLACRALLLQTVEGRNILFDAGIGAFFEPKLKDRFGVYETEHLLLKNLAALGLQEEDIDAVVLSHLHFDHAGGLLSAYGEPARLLFPQATYYVGARHWKRAFEPHTRDRASFIPQLNQRLKDSKRVVLFDEAQHPDLPNNIYFRFSEGHTVGLLIPMLELDDGPLAFVTDLVPGLPWVHLPVTMGYDRYPELLVDEKEALLKTITARQGRLFFTHDPNQAFANVSQDPTTGKFLGV